MWLSTIIRVGRSVVLWNVSNARASISQIIGVGHAGDVPSISHKTRRHIFAERPIRRTVERNVIVVVHPAEIGEFQMSGKRCRFAANPLHQIAVRTHRVDVVIEDLKSGTVEVRRQPLARRSPCLRCCQRLGPSGPVVVSTPEVMCDSGCPGVRLPNCRKRLISSIGTESSFKT